MSQIQKHNPNAIAAGSLQDIARKSGVSLAEAFINCEAVVMVDTSGSMNTKDVRPGTRDSRYKVACDELAKLQAETPGKIAVVAFSNEAEFCPTGFPRYIGGSTAMHRALEFIKVADGCGIRLILISDGEPNCGTEAQTLALARTFTSKIDTIYIGPEGENGARFLQELANTTGGIATTQVTNKLNELGATVRLMLEG
jgi:Mg-chelatase subunit ChlD